MKWNQINKRIESMLTDSVKKRVTFGVTTYKKCHHHRLGRGWISIDGKQILSMSDLDYDLEVYFRGRAVQIPYEIAELEVQSLNLFSKYNFKRSLLEYLSLSIGEILISDNPIIRATGMLDARRGKQRLLKVDVTAEHDLVRRLYLLRCAADNIIPSSVDDNQIDLTEVLEKRWKEPQGNYVVNADASATKLLRANKTRKIKTLISMIHRRELAPDDLVTEVSRELFAGFEEAENGDSLYKFLLQVEDKSKLFKSPRLIKGLVALAREFEKGRIPLTEWRPELQDAVVFVATGSACA